MKFLMYYFFSMAALFGAGFVFDGHPLLIVGVFINMGAAGYLYELNRQADELDKALADAFDRALNKASSKDVTEFDKNDGDGHAH